MGDVRPFVALAAGLQQQGHRVTLAGPENFKALAGAAGVPFFPLGGNIEERVRDPAILRLVRARDNLRFLIGLLKASDDLQPQIFRGMLELSGQADVLLTSTLNIFYVDAIAEHLGKRWAMLLPSPPMTETAAYPFPDFDAINFPWYNRMTYRLVNFAFWQVFKKRVRIARASLGLPPPATNLLRAYLKRGIPILYLFSPRLLPQPADWPANCLVTGYLSLEEGRPPDPALTTWLRSGSRPLYIGFGSIPIPDPDLVAAIIARILETTPHRVVFCKGWSELPSLPDDPDLCVIEHADHSWLLPQCIAAIHHGGAGTTGATLKAQIPSIVLSLFGDQPQWGKIVERRGVGLHLPFRRLTVRRFLRALENVLSPPFPQQAALVGGKVAKEDGVRLTIETLDSFFT